ncbi:MAG: sulfate adenylyltransferase [Patescibacteria group bacterium]
MIQPHGNVLINRVLKPEDALKAKIKADGLKKIKIDEELVKEVKNIARGVFSPLDGFMNKADFESVVENMHLANGVVWPLPFVLDINDQDAESIAVGDQIALIDDNNEPIALMNVEDKYNFDKDNFAVKVFKTNELAHPGAKMVSEMYDILIGGEIELIDNSKEPFNSFNLDPLETRTLFKERGWNTVVGFQTRNAPHLAHEYIQRCALEICDGLFVNPVIGKKKSGDFQDQVILDSYQALINNFFPKQRVVMSILPLKMRYAGPREAIFHAIVRKNFGCTHFIVGRDHAGVGKYYGTYEAQEIFDTIEDLGMTILKFEHSFYCKKCRALGTAKNCPHTDEDRIGPSGTIIREMISKGELVPEEIMRPEISKVLIDADKTFVD